MWPLTIKPVGMKKLVPNARSINCMTPAASSGGKASSSRKAVTNCAQTKNGRRIQVMPRRAELDDGGNEIDRAEQRRGDVEDHADEPERLASS